MKREMKEMRCLDESQDKGKRISVKTNLWIICGGQNDLPPSGDKGG